MDSKKILSLLGLTVIFFVCLAIGYLIPIEGTGGTTLFSTSSSGQGGGDAGALFSQSPSDSSSKPAESDSNAPKTTAKAKNGRRSGEADGKSSASDKPAQKSTVSLTHSLPVIEGKPVVGRANKRFGFACRVKASVASGDPLEYRLCEVGSLTPKYVSRNGGFGMVAPSKSGKYDLVVVNVKTNDMARMTISGFDRVSRLSAKKLQEKLNMPMDDWFYIYFVEDKDMVIEYEFLPPGFEPAKSIGALMSDRTANGWTLEVVGTPQYDEYNRIRSFKVRILE